MKKKKEEKKIGKFSDRVRLVHNRLNGNLRRKKRTND